MGFILFYFILAAILIAYTTYTNPNHKGNVWPKILIPVSFLFFYLLFFYWVLQVNQQEPFHSDPEKSKGIQIFFTSLGNALSEVTHDFYLLLKSTLLLVLLMLVLLVFENLHPNLRYGIHLFIVYLIAFLALGGVYLLVVY